MLYFSGREADSDRQITSLAIHSMFDPKHELHTCENNKNTV